MSMWRIQLVSLWTMLCINMVRYKRSLLQALLPPLITSLLYFLIFGTVMGSYIGTVDKVSYISYIAPGLIMMTLINTSFSGTLGAFFVSKFFRNIQEILISPTSSLTLLIGQTLTGVIRGMVSAVLVTIIASFFVSLSFSHWVIVLVTALLTSMLFSQLGFTNALFAKKWDDISVISTFILTPMSYLGGVFFSIKHLPPVWQQIALYNPIIYIVNAFRYGFINISDIPIEKALFFIVVFMLAISIMNYYLLKRGVGLRT